MQWEKKTQEVAEVQGGEVTLRPKEYRIDAEVGRIEVDTFEVKKGSRKVFSTKKDVFPEKGPREAHKTACLRELALFYPCDESYRKSAKTLNRALRRGKGQEVKVRTIANLVEREGEQIQIQVEKMAEHILQGHGFNTDGVLIDQEKAKESIERTEALLDPKVVTEAVKEFNNGQAKEKQIDLLQLHESLEDPKTIKANISIDDVCCKKQKAEGRKKGSPPKEKREMVNNTVVHIQNKEAKTYTMNTPTISQMMPIVLAFLLSNELLSKPGSLVFFTDGARDLRSAIQDIFSFIPFKIILDWYHLEKKCKNLLSMAISGKEAKKQVLTALLARLWLGKVDQAQTLLQELSQESIKNQKELDNLINYLDRNSSCIPCYAIRQKLGLRTSSNPVEKANDLLVSSRQKHDGMSWSADGSTSLATLTSVRHNSEDRNWLLDRNIRFQFDATVETPAA